MSAPRFPCAVSPDKRHHFGKTGSESVCLHCGRTKRQITIERERYDYRAMRRNQISGGIA